MNVMRQHSNTSDDPFAAISTDIDQVSNQLVLPTEFGSGIVDKPAEDHSETETTETETDHLEDETPAESTQSPAVGAVARDSSVPTNDKQT